MKLLHVRLTVRRMMVVVAVAGLAFAVETWRRRYHDCLSKAARYTVVERSHMWLAGSHQSIAALYQRHSAEHRGSVRYNDEQARLYARAAGAERAAAKRAASRGEAYRRAARYPWLAIPTDDLAPTAPVLGASDERNWVSDPGEWPRR
jgi:hypothetical protein